MKKVIKYKDWKFEIDINRTKEVYAKLETGSAEGCECSYCKNFIANRENIYPQEVKKLLHQVGVDYKKESEVYQICKLENGKHLYGGWFHFKGKIIEGKDCKVKNTNGSYKYDLIRINEYFQIGFYKESSCSYFDKEEINDLIQIEFQASSDWVIEGELED